MGKRGGEFYVAMKSGGAGWPRRTFHDGCLMLCSNRLLVVPAVMAATAARLSPATTVGLATGAVRLSVAAGR